MLSNYRHPITMKVKNLQELLWLLLILIEIQIRKYNYVTVFIRSPALLFLCLVLIAYVCTIKKFIRSFRRNTILGLIPWLGDNWPLFFYFRADFAKTANQNIRPIGPKFNIKGHLAPCHGIRLLMFHDKFKIVLGYKIKYSSCLFFYKHLDII